MIDMPNIKQKNGIRCQTYKDLATSLGITTVTLYHWRKKYGINALSVEPREKKIYKGKEHTYVELAIMSPYDLSPELVRERIVLHGWSVDEAVNTPKYVRRKSRRH